MIMIIKQKINNIRKIPEKPIIKYEVIYSSLVLIFSLALGTIAKALDSVSIIGEIGTEMGVWIFIATIISAYSRYPITAALNSTLFFLGMLCTYYSYTYFVLGFFPKSYFFLWLVLSLTLAPVAGFAVWFSRGKGFVSMIASAIPISVLFLFGFPAIYTQKITLYFTLLYGLILNFILPIEYKNKIIVFFTSIVLALVLSFVLRWNLF